MRGHFSIGFTPVLHSTLLPREFLPLPQMRQMVRWLCSLEAVILEDMVPTATANASTSTNVNVMMTGIIVASAAAVVAIINHCLFLCEEELGS